MSTSTTAGGRNQLQSGCDLVKIRRDFTDLNRRSVVAGPDTALGATPTYYNAVGTIANPHGPFAPFS